MFHKEGFSNLYGSVSIVWKMKSVRHVITMTRSTYRILMRKYVVKRPPERPRKKWKFAAL